MGGKFIFSILSLEDIEFYDIFGNLVNQANWGKGGQIGLFDIFVLNCDIKTLLGHIGCIENEN